MLFECLKVRPVVVLCENIVNFNLGNSILK